MSSARRRWITRGRVLVGLPVGLGLFFSLPLFLLVLRPIWQNVQELEQRRDALLLLRRNMPVLVQKLEMERVALEEVSKQQAVLIDLLAGRAKVQTLLALLNQKARISGVMIQRYEPMKLLTPSLETEELRSEFRSGDEEANEGDPLLALGYQKSSVALAVRGSYVGLKEFLQQMESLELWVESSDLELKAASNDDDGQGVSDPVALRTELTLVLSFYDSREEIDDDSGNSQEMPAS